MSVLQKRTEFSDYLFRCHSLGRLMVGVHTGLTDRQQAEYDKLYPRSQGEGNPLTDKQLITLAGYIEKKNAKPQLSEGAKSFCQEIFDQEFHGRKKEFTNKYTEKGIIMQEKGTSLYTEVMKTRDGIKKPPLTNKERYLNDYLTGEPDFIYEDVVYDIKCSWSLDSFPQHDTELKNSMYEWQCKAYLWLTGMERAKLVYCLVDTPEHLVQYEKYKMAQKIGVIDLPSEVDEEIEWMHNYMDFSVAERVREFEVGITEKDKEIIIQQVTLAREYLNQLVNDYQTKFNLKITA